MSPKQKHGGKRTVNKASLELVRREAEKTAARIGCELEGCGYRESNPQGW